MTWRWPHISGWKWPTRALQGRRLRTETRPVDPWSAAPSAPERVETPVALLLSEIEASASAVYARHGLPEKRGHYARSPRAATWRFLSEDLTAEERWSLVTAQRPGSGWRFGSLEDLGDQPDSPPEVRRAARMLRACRSLRIRLAEGGSPSLGEELEAAIHLGSEWRQLDAAALPLMPGSEPLKLTLPSRPRPKRKSRARPKA